MRIKFSAMIFILTILLCQCTSYDFARRTVQQGNLLPDDDIKRINKGMSKEDVAVLMGTSLISPMFNTSRWDYAYTLRRGNEKGIRCKLEIWFKNNRVVKVEHLGGDRCGSEYLIEQS